MEMAHPSGNETTVLLTTLSGPRAKSGSGSMRYQQPSLLEPPP